MKKHKGLLRLFSIIVLAFMLLAGCADEEYWTETGGSDIGQADEDAEEIPVFWDPEDSEDEVGPTATPVDEPDDDEIDTQQEEAPGEPQLTEETAKVRVVEDAYYSSKDDVALYIHTYGKLPENFITKKEAKKLGWEGGSLETYAPGKSIGGDYFGNYEGVLPEGNYHECDIDTAGKRSRGSKRIVYDDKGNIYYTDDHYESFIQLY